MPCCAMGPRPRGEALQDPEGAGLMEQSGGALDSDLGF